MADGRHLKTVKSPYLGNGLTDRHEIWYVYAQYYPNELFSALHCSSCTTIHLLFSIIYVVKLQKLFLKTKLA